MFYFEAPLMGRIKRRDTEPQTKQERKSKQAVEGKTDNENGLMKSANKRADRHLRGRLVLLEENK